MNSMVLALLLGIAAAAVDIVPMAVRRLDAAFIVSAGLFWLAWGALLPRVAGDGPAWAVGLALAAVLFLPLAPLVYRLDRPALPVILGTAAGLSSLAGFAYGLWA